MTSIILASHGDLASGVKNAGDIVFGAEENVKVISFVPDSGPDQLKDKFAKEIAELKDSGETLFLVDLFGGTPFNAASSFVVKDPKHRALLSGLNLPMLIEAYSARLTYKEANKLADYLVSVSKMGIKKFDSSASELQF